MKSLAHVTKALLGASGIVVVFFGSGLALLEGARPSSWVVPCVAACLTGLVLFGLAADAFRRPLYFLVPVSFILSWIVFIVMPMDDMPKIFPHIGLSAVLAGLSAYYARRHYESLSQQTGED